MPGQTVARRWLPLAILFCLTACRDVAAPLGEVANPEFSLGAVTGKPTASEQLHVLQQSLTAPPLETYQVAFWARKDRASTVTVNYLPRSGQSARSPFLRFDIPRDGLVSVPGDERFGRRDSVFITLTIDPESFSVDFQPSGVVFDRRHPATLVMWYENANPDLNADGVVNAADAALTAQLALWTRQATPSPWQKLGSGVEPTQPFVYSTLRHFSQYAVSW